jgi:putative transposase
MSALPTSLAEIDRRRWLTVEQVAALSGLSERAIQLQCRAQKICAKQVPPEVRGGGGRWSWIIDGQTLPADLRLGAQRKLSDAQSAAKLNDKQRAQAYAAAQLIDEVEQYVNDHEHAANKPIKTLIKEALMLRKSRGVKTPSISGYYRTRERYIEGQGSLVHLADRRLMPGMGKVAALFSQEAWEFFYSEYAVQNGPAAGICYRDLKEMAIKKGWAVPSLKTIMRRWNALPLKQRVEAREGPEARRNQCDLFQPRSYAKMLPNDDWLCDHHIMDIIAFDDLPGGDGLPRRLWLTPWMDIRSRYIVSYRVHRGPDKIKVMASFRDAILQYGIPKMVYLDNGKDFRCKQFAGGRDWRDTVSRVELNEAVVAPLLYQLGVTPHYALPYNAKAKLIEPWFKHWVIENFARFQPGYCGGNVVDKPEQLAEQVKNGQLRKWSQILIDLENIMVAYNLSSHEFHDGKSPAIVRQEIPFDQRTADIRTLNLLLQDQRIITVGRNGLLVDDRYYGYDLPEVMRYQGEKLRVRLDEHRAGLVYVYDLSDSYICDATYMPLMDANATPEDVKAGTIRRKHAEKTRITYEAVRIYEEARDPAIIAALRRQSAERQHQLSSPSVPPCLNASVPSDIPQTYRPIEFHGRGGGGGQRHLPAPGARASCPQSAEKPTITAADLAGDENVSNFKVQKELPQSAQVAGISDDPWSTIIDAG